MRFITIRDLRSKSAQIQRELPKEKEMVLTSHGKPVAILASTSADRVEETLAMMRRLRAMAAVDYMQRRSVEEGTGRMALKDIDKEIAASRKSRRAR